MKQITLDWHKGTHNKNDLAGLRLQNFLTKIFTLLPLKYMNMLSISVKKKCLSDTQFNNQTETLLEKVSYQNQLPHGGPSTQLENLIFLT